MRLDSLDTTETLSKGFVRTGEQGNAELTFEKLGPAVTKRQDEGSRFTWLKDLPPLAKATGTILTAIVAIGAPSIWWISKLDTNVDNLKTNVSEVKTRTEDLFRASVQQGGRLDVLEKSVETIRTEAKGTQAVLPTPPLSGKALGNQK